MLRIDIGNRFQVTSNILGIEDTVQRRVAVIVPAGEILRIRSQERAGPAHLKIVDVSWGNRTVTVFVHDIEQHTKEVRVSRVT